MLPFILGLISPAMKSASKTSCIPSTVTTKTSTISTMACKSMARITITCAMLEVIIAIGYTGSECHNNEEEEECLVHLGVVSQKLVTVTLVGAFI